MDRRPGGRPWRRPAGAHPEVKRVAVLVSGRGSNLQSLIAAEARGELGAALALVISDRAGVLALDRAERAGIETAVLRIRDYSSREEWDAALAERLRRAEPDIVVTAGFRRVLGASTLTSFAGRILNIHPSLLPAFPGGMHAPADALAHGVKVTGCTVHLADEGVDGGPIVIQRAVEVRDDDDVESLAERILVEEHRALPEAVRLLAEGRIRVDGRRVRILAPAPSL
jgi:phosphoribosylglycinamide formyltransferase 1